MYKNILIATDGSKLATKGLAHGLAIALSFNVPVTIMTATAPFEMIEQVEPGDFDPVGTYEKNAAKESKKILSSAEMEAKNIGVRCASIHVKNRYPGEAILETVKSKRCDLIIMASHGKGRLKKALLGSVAAEILAHSEVPVFIVR